MTVTKEELGAKIDIAPWDLLCPHLERGSLIIVSKELELPEVAFNIAADSKEIIERWIMKSLINKPTLEQIEEWNQNRQKLFNMIVITPFIVIQEI